jgi:hypothetical protein
VKRSRWTILLLLTGAYALSAAALAVAPLAPVLLETFGTYRWPWLALTCSGAAVAVVLSRIAPLVNRGRSAGASA